MDDFKNAPVSIAEAVSEKEWDARRWTPRDALIATLREIDNGLNIDKMVIVYSVPNNIDKTRATTNARYAGTNTLESAGMLLKAINFHFD